LDSLQGEVEQARVDAAQHDAARLAAEWQAEVAASSGAGERARLEEDLAEIKAGIGRVMQSLEEERSGHESRHEASHQEHRGKLEEVQRKVSAEREALHDQHSKHREEIKEKVEAVRQEAESQRKSLLDVLDGHRDRLLDKERETGALEGKMHALSAEVELLRGRVKDVEEQARKAEATAEQQRRENSELERQLTKAKTEAIHATMEIPRPSELERAGSDLPGRASVDMVPRGLPQIRSRSLDDTVVSGHTTEDLPTSSRDGEADVARMKGCGMGLRRFVRRRADSMAGA